MKKNNMADSFLNSIIENFTNKNYIFLNSFRFTTQGICIWSKQLIFRKHTYSLYDSQGDHKWIKAVISASKFYSWILILQKVRYQWLDKLWDKYFLN